MIDFRVIKKKITLFFSSYIFFLFLSFSFGFYFCNFVYSYIQERQNSTIFPTFYDLVERYEGCIKSSSSLPFKELLEDIDDGIKKIGFFSSLKDQFFLLKISTLLHLKKFDEALILLEKYGKDDLNHELYFLYSLAKAMSYAESGDSQIKQTGVSLLKKYANTSIKYQDVAIFYYGYFLLKTTSLRQADDAWNPLKLDPKFSKSPYKEMIERARNCDY